MLTIPSAHNPFQTISGHVEITDVLSSEELAGVLDNVSNGIGVFVGEAHQFPVPAFSTSKLQELLSISSDDFFTHMSPDNCYAIHPDDQDRAVRLCRESVHTGKSLRDTFRMQTGLGDYRYVTVWFNTHIEQDGRIKLYSVFSDADEAEHLRRMQEKRYQNFSRRRAQIAESNVAYCLLNLTENSCVDGYYRNQLSSNMTHLYTAEDFIAALADNIPSPTHKDNFLRSFSLSALWRALEEGDTNIEMRIPLLLQKFGMRWYRMIMELSYNPRGEAEAFAVFNDIDREVRLSNVVDRMLVNEYEYLCQINTTTCFVTQIGSSAESIIPEDATTQFRYQDIYQRAIRRMLPMEYWEEGEEALSLEAIIQGLETSKSYVCTFPVTLADGNGERICQWSCEYVDSMHSAILMTRINISKYLAYGYDPLTGMLARNGFFQQTREELNANLQKKYYLIEMDFDNFSLINDELGYDMGNSFLRRFSSELRQKVKMIGRGTLVGHLETDHFAVLLPHECNATPEEFYHLISSQLLSYSTNRLKLRMGVYDIVNPSLDVELMMDCTHLALKTCKRSFNMEVAYYTVSQRDKMLDDQLLAAEMQIALESGQFELYFQPQVNHSCGGSLMGAEVLARWNHPKRGMVSPAVFIPLFEQNGFIYELDKYIWRHSCIQLRRWLDEGFTPVPLSVNISRMDIIHSDFLETITAIVDESRIPHHLLHLEVTESALTEHGEQVISVVKELIERGFTIAIDDFGSGYSSLSMLKSVPAQILKLDMRFFEGNSDSHRNECIIESVIRMAHMLDMSVMAEGVEYAEQADFLQSVGCHYIQGFLYARPMPYNEFMTFSHSQGHGLGFTAH